ncbi:MAG TPA: TerC/Alx family metal homeostasis membrane protein [Clostridia bacterium]|nr:TerC/Alx family metal homeostasis membrane protein [Clostridia bacterium]
MADRKTLPRVLFWILLALCFNTGIYFLLGREKALEFLGGYVLEQSLSVDNLFMFLMLFTNYGIRPHQQRRVLSYGIIGAVVLRLVFILLGVAVVSLFHWVLYIFGIVLVISGMGIVFKDDSHSGLRDKKILKAMGKVIPITERLYGERFFVRKGKVLYATPLFAIIILVELTDIIFAIDSIPAIFSITTDVFIVFSSNIFAILGLRSMFFALGSLQERFRYVKYGVAMILTFTGLKLLIMIFDIEIPVAASLGIIASILLVSILLSLAISDKSCRNII